MRYINLTPAEEEMEDRGVSQVASVEKRGALDLRRGETDRTVGCGVTHGWRGTAIRRNGGSSCYCAEVTGDGSDLDSPRLHTPGKRHQSGRRAIKGMHDTPGVYPSQGGGDEISLLQLATMLLKGWRIVVGIPLTVTLLAVVISLILPVKYRATASFVPESESQGLQLPGALMGLDSQFGVGTAGETNSPELYVDVAWGRTLRDLSIERHSTVLGSYHQVLRPGVLPAAN